MKELDDLLLHYGVKGMKWRSNRSDSEPALEDTDTGGGGSSETSETAEDLKKIEDKLDDIKGKVGDGPLDIIKYILFGKPKKVTKNTNPSKDKTSDRFDNVSNKLRDIKSKVGNNPLDTLKYIVTGKRKIQHSGVKGMRWGIRRDYDGSGGADGKPDAKDKPIRTSLGRKLNSLKRERQWKTVLSEMDKLTTKDITTVTKRVALENGLKTLSRSKVGTKKDKEDYLRREHMSNEELARKVLRLRAKESLHNAVLSASKEQREFGQKLVQIGGSIGVKYVINKTVSGNDLFEIVKNPKGSADKAKQDLLKVVMEKVKSKQSKP